MKRFQRRIHQKLRNNIYKISRNLSFGHRNVQGIAIHPVTSEIWAHEHGPQEETN